MDQIVALLAHGVVVEYEHDKRQIVANGGVEIGDVHHE